MVYQVEHSYAVAAPTMEEPLIKFMSGFTAFRRKKVANDCTDCLLTFTQFREEADSGHDFTRMKEMYDGYSYASNEMVDLIKAVEKAVQESIHHHGFHKDMYITALRYLRLTPGQMVGCVNHMESVTKKLVTFYLTMRMFFAADRKNEEIEEKNKAKSTMKKYTKQAKLT